MTTNYQEQATSFLTAHNTKLTVKYLKHAPYFNDDKESRDIYRFTLKRGRKSYTGTFGQSIASAGQEPDAYVILSCITKQNPDTFENFCSNFGYDTDSRSAEKIYKGCIKEWKGICRVFDIDGSGEHSTILNELHEIN